MLLEIGRTSGADLDCVKIRGGVGKPKVAESGAEANAPEHKVLAAHRPAEQNTVSLEVNCHGVRKG